MKKLANVALILTLVALPAWFGYLGKAAEMGMMVMAVSLALTFTNLEKFKKLKGGGFEAELKEAVDEAYAAIEQVKELGLCVTESVASALAVVDQPGSYIHVKHKLENAKAVEVSLRKLGATEDEIKQATGVLFDRVREDHIKKIVSRIDDLATTDQNKLKGPYGFDVSAWDKDELESLATERRLNDSDLKERIKDLEYFDKHRSLRREDIWQG